MLEFISFIVCFLASVVGAICGIGGGVIIKPVLDSLGIFDVVAVSFLSSCTVLGMSCYAIVKGKISGDFLVNTQSGTPLSIGAAAGGIIGKYLFQFILELSQNDQVVGIVQAICLLIITVGALLYTIKKDKIKTYSVANKLICMVIGLVLGVLSSFLGIGGGPINLIVLFYFFSMDMKEAAQSSLYIIMFSQIASMLNTIITGNLPKVSVLLVILMIIGGIAGGVLGRIMNKFLKAMAVQKLFILLMVIIVGLNIYNIGKFVGHLKLLS